MRKSYLYKPERNTERKKRRLILFLLAGLLIIAALFILLKGCPDLLIYGVNNEEGIFLEDDSSAIDGMAEGKDRDHIINELEKQQVVVKDKLSSNILFSSGEVGTIGEWVVQNPEDNEVIMQAEVYLDGLLIAKSTPIYPNQYIRGIELLQELISGEYDAAAYLNYYDIETKKFISKAGYTVHLTVK